MFAQLKLIFNKKNKELRNRILFTFLCLFVFKLGTSIIVPGVDTTGLGDHLGFLELVNAMGGGAMEKFSVLALGVMPYITASIVIQLLMVVFPSLSDMVKNNIDGKEKLDKIKDEIKRSKSKLIYIFLHKGK